MNNVEDAKDILCEDCVFYSGCKNNRRSKKTGKIEKPYIENCQNAAINIKEIDDTTIAKHCPGFERASIRSTLKTTDPTKRKLKRHTKLKVVKKIKGVVSSPSSLKINDVFIIAGYDNRHGELRYRIEKNLSCGNIARFYESAKNIDPLYELGFFEKL